MATRPGNETASSSRTLHEYGLLDEAKQLGVLPESIVMKDAVDSSELTRLDLKDLERKYGFPYMVIHRSDLHGIFLRACRRAGVELLTDQVAVDFQNSDRGARVTFEDGHVEEAGVVIAADGLHSVARKLLVDDQPVNSAYVAYRGAMPIEQVRDNDISESDVVLYVGPQCHFVQYPLPGGAMFNQVAVFESPKALAGEDDWGTPDELDAAFEGTCSQVREGIPLMWRDRWWRMFDRDPIMNWVHGRIALLGDAAHPPLQYMAQGAIMAIEDGWVLAEHVGRQLSSESASSTSTGTLPCRRTTQCDPSTADVCSPPAGSGASCGTSTASSACSATRSCVPATYDYTFTDWIYDNTALFPEEQPPMYPTIPPDSIEVAEQEPRELVAVE